MTEPPRAPSSNDPGRLATALKDRYQIEVDSDGRLRLLGQGGMATVYLARDLKHRRRVAVKVLKPELAAVLGADRFLREIEIAAGLRHPHIVPVYDSGEAAGQLYYVMPYVEGESLRSRLIREKQLPIDEAVRLAAEVSDALSYAHRGGVVHRDIKPENILLDSGHAVVTDFGIARAITSAGGPNLTDTGLALGTPGYMAPEHVGSGGAIDGRTDQYGLASVLYEMLAGEPPFTGASAQAVIAQRFATPAPLIASRRSGVPAAIEAAVERGLARTAEDRFPSMEAFAAALRLTPDGASARARPAPRRKLVWGVGIILAAGLVTVAALTLRDWPPRAAGALVEQSVAVMPFANTSGSKEDDYLAEAITDELSSALVALEGVRVAPRSSAHSFKATSVDARSVGRKLGVAMVVEGSMSRIGPRVHVTTELIRTTDGKTLWSDSFDRTTDSTSDVQRDVVPQIVGRLRLKLANRGGAEAISFGTANPEAHDLYSKGRYYWNQRFAGGAETAIPYFEQAIRKDPQYARAYAGLSDSYSYLSMFGGAPPIQYAEKAKATALKALSLDPESAEAVTSLGLFHITFDWDWRAADTAFTKALGIAPRSAQIRLYHAFYLLAVGNSAEALEETKRAEEFEPFLQIATARVGQFYYFNHRYDEAIRQLHKALEFDSTYRLAQSMIGYAFSQVGRHDSAIVWAAKSVHGPQRTYGPGSSALGTAYALAGRRSDALAEIQALHQGSKQHYVAPLSFAFIYAALGERDSAFAWLERSYADRVWGLTYARAEPVFDALHSDPRWAVLLRKIGVP